MKYIANILTDKLFADKELYNVVKTKEDLIDGIPTLVVGWEFTKLNYPKVEIVDWKIDENTYWTFGNRERRAVYEERIEKFKEEALEKFTKSIKYVPINILTGRGVTDFSSAIDEEFSKIYIYGDMVYAYSPENKCVYGMSLRDIDYCGRSTGKDCISAIYRKKASDVVSVKDTLSAETRYSFRNCNYIIPYLLS